MDVRNVRDFIYIDIDRVKSIISQLEEGLVDQTQTLKGKSEGAALGGEGGITGFLKGKADSELKLHQQLSETKSMHDYIYNKAEKLLLDKKQLLRVPNKETSYSEKMRDSIGRNSFVLVRGKILINDFSQLKKLIDNWEKLSKYFAKCSIHADRDKLTLEQANETYMNLLQNFTKDFDEEMRKGMLLFIDMFYKDRIVIKIIPYVESPDFRLVGNIDKQYLRDDIDSITYKYGTAPYSNWTIFGQIASLPPKNESNEQFNMTGNQIESAFNAIFDEYRNIERMAQSVTYPEIAITPIAIYRE
ncbi:hypothetical protein ASJ81_19525 [Methanosarcina spelaei]|uniref:Uncharacterized protein n=1 Tax=Methanosarcina spelaei TaxID=1036679 RepID=A0A2A2HUC0_9EURY|nr:hypothetical protein [Methanosarcina spelaei]PAV12880.1 hypothetical protein ASJ81_19525 [Methanosarcina spelaei]